MTSGQGARNADYVLVLRQFLHSMNMKAYVA